MNPEALKTRIAAQYKTLDLDGQPWRLKKISTPDGIALQKFLETRGFGKDPNIEDTEDDTAALYVFLLSKTTVDENGGKYYDSDEGRAQLSQLPHVDLWKVGKESQKWSGLGDPDADDSKKNDTPLNDSQDYSLAPSSDGTTSSL